MKWVTKKTKIKDLKLLDNNPRTITEEEVKRLVKSLKDQGNFKPLIVNADLTVLGGNQRLRALQAMNISEVEVSIPDRQLTKAEAKKIVLLDNDHNGEFDFDILANEFEDAIRELELDMNLPSDFVPENEISDDRLDKVSKLHKCPICDHEFVD